MAEYIMPLYNIDGVDWLNTKVDYINEWPYHGPKPYGWRTCAHAMPLLDYKDPRNYCSISKENRIYCEELGWPRKVGGCFCGYERFFYFQGYRRPPSCNCFVCQHDRPQSILSQLNF